MNSQLNAYKQTNIKTAGQGKLIVMLYDEAIKQMDWALEELQKDKPSLDKVNSSLCRAQDVITELEVSLDFEKGGEIATNLLNLYVFFNRQLLEANIKKDASMISSIRKMVGELRDAWVSISRTASGSGAKTGGGVNIAG